MQRRIHSHCAAALCAATLGIASSAWTDDARSYSIYVTNEISGDLSIIDGASREVVDTVPLGKRPRGIQLSPDGRRLFVALSGSPLSPPGVDESTLPPADKSADGIGVFSIEDRMLERVVRGVSDPEQLAIARDGRYLYIASEDTGRAVITDADTGEAVASLPVGGEPEGVAISPDGRFVYMTSESDHQVSVIDTEQRDLAGQFAVGQRPRGVAFSPDGRTAYVTGELDASLTVIDAESHEVVETVHIPGDGALPMGIAVSPDGDAVYVTTGRGRMLVALDAETFEVTGQVEVGMRPWGVALSPDGRYAFTANGPSDDVSVIDTESMTVVERVAAGTRPWGVVVVPAQLEDVPAPPQE